MEAIVATLVEGKYGFCGGKLRLLRIWTWDERNAFRLEYLEPSEHAVQQTELRLRISDFMIAVVAISCTLYNKA